MTLEAAMEDLRYCIQRHIAPSERSLKTVYDNIVELKDKSAHQNRKIKQLESWLSPITDPRVKWNSVTANPPVAYQVEWWQETKDTVLLLYSKAHWFVCGWYLGADEDGNHQFEVDESLYGGDELLEDVTHWMPIPEPPDGRTTMTDDEIIKALECCNCGDDQRALCPYHDAEHCNVQLEHDIYDLINRQKAEIGRLQNNNLSMQSTLAKMLMVVEQDRSDEIKEFAERLKEAPMAIKNYLNATQKASEEA